MRATIILLGGFLAVPALAATTPAAPPPGQAVVSSDGTVVVAGDVCQKVRAIPVVPGAAYVPGVDAEGNAVAPADLPSQAPDMKLENLPIEINVNLQKRFGIPANAKLFTPKAQAGIVTVRDGAVYFNGQPLVPAEQTALQAACAPPKR